MIGHLFRSIFLALVCATATIGSAAARSSFDGAWSVLIVTQRGNCDRAYRYGITISNGHVRYDGGMVRMSGTVSPSGAVQVRVSADSAYANGSGRLRGNAG